MKRRILSLTLALALLLTLCLAAAPAAAVSASDYPLYYTNVNSKGVYDAYTAPEVQSYWPDFGIDGSDFFVQAISVYHWNSGLGAAPGLVGIYDWDTDVCWGEWPATGRAGNTWWDVYPNIALEGGCHYYIRTTSDETWSFNSASDYYHFVEIRGYSTGGDVPVSPDPVPPSRQTAAVEVTVNGSYVGWTDAWPFIDENSRTMVPLRAVAEALGLTVGWNDAAKEASFTDGSRAIIFPIGSRTAYSGGGGRIEMDTAAVIVNSRTYAPIRYLAEFFGFAVGWDGATKTVLITGALQPGWSPAGEYSFAAMGIDADVDNHGAKAYRTVTKNGKAVSCTAKVSSYRVFEEDDAMPGFPGYEWRIMIIDVTTPERDESGLRQLLLSSNYYDIKLDEDSLEMDDNDVEHHAVNWQGRQDEYSLWWRVDSESDDGFRLTFTAQVPKGFDGLVVGLMNVAVSDGADAGDYLYQYYTGPQDFALFRMK